MPRVRALDGLRGLAVAGVLAYHCGFDDARGGFLGVSLFFTLSGFLITSLLLAERASTGRIELGRFWARRARRLLPASLVALGGIVAFGATVATGSQLRDLRGDVLGALGYVANWRFVLAGASYGDLWSSPSPVQHFWSLAIEEQLYVVLPLVVAGTLALAKGRRLPVAAVLGAGFVASVAATFAVDDRLRAYYGTDVRAAELLAGALLAVVVAVRPSTGARLRVAGLGALALLVVAWSAVSHTDGRLYRGGLLAHAAVAVVVIAAARHDGPLASALSIRPLRWLGRISYGAYLYHWPIFLWLTPDRTGLDGLSLAGLRLSVSLAAATLSAALLEEPIRDGLRFRRAGAGAVAVSAAAAAVAVVLVVVTAAPPKPAISIDLTAAPRLVSPSTALVASSGTTSTAAAPSTLVPVAEPSTPAAVEPVSEPWAGERPLRVYVAGDSNAYILGLKLFHWGETRDVEVWSSGWFACHIVPGGTYRWAGEPKHTEPQCNDWPETRAREIREIDPDVVLVLYGSFDLLDRQWDGSDEWTHVGRPDFDAALRENIATMTDLLGAEGARVLWTTHPRVRTGVRDGIKPEVDFPEFAAHRVDRLNTFIRQAVAARPFADVIELRRYMQAWPNGELDEVKRPDGLHPDDAEAVRIASWLGEQILAAAAR